MSDCYKLEGFSGTFPVFFKSVSRRKCLTSVSVLDTVTVIFIPIIVLLPCSVRFLVSLAPFCSGLFWGGRKSEAEASSGRLNRLPEVKLDFEQSCAASRATLWNSSAAGCSDPDGRGLVAGEVVDISC